MGLFSKKTSKQSDSEIQKKQIWNQFNADLEELEKVKYQLSVISTNLREMQEVVDIAQNSIDDSIPDAILALIKFNIKLINQNKIQQIDLQKTCHELECKTNVITLRQRLSEVDKQ